MDYRLGALVRRSQEIEELLARAEIASDPEQFTKLAKERADLEPVVAVYRQIQAATRELEDARELANDPDPELAAMARPGDAEEAAELAKVLAASATAAAEAEAAGATLVAAVVIGAAPLTTPAAAAAQAASWTAETTAGKPEADPVALVKPGYEVGDRIPEFYVRPLDESKITSQQMLDGGRPVFLYFFETW